MRKHKIEFKKYAEMYDLIELEGNDGTKVTVRSHIPYEDKMKLAQELCEEALMVHEDSICYEGYLIYAIKLKKMIEYYTDIKTDDIDPKKVADFVINNGLESKLRQAIQDDWNAVEDIFYSMSRGVMDTFTDDRGLTKAIRTSFGFLFNGEDITESLAKAEATKDTIYKALGALDAKEKEESEKMNDGKLVIGNNIINFAKRKE